MMLCYDNRSELAAHPLFFDEPKAEFNDAAQIYKGNRDRIRGQTETAFDQAMLKELDDYLFLRDEYPKEKAAHQDEINQIKKEQEQK